ncbi:MAG TPA: copper resistance CopC family protein [Rhizomicrobium sp.]
MRNRIALMALCVIAAPVAALAHAHLVKAAPAAGEICKTSPAEIDLDFTEALEPAFSSITVTGEKGEAVNAALSVASGTFNHIVLKKLAPGKYHVHWVSVAIDTHRTSGDYDFSVAP